MPIHSATLAAVVATEETHLIELATQAADPPTCRAAADAYDTVQTVINATGIRKIINGETQ